MGVYRLCPTRLISIEDRPFHAWSNNNFNILIYYIFIMGRAVQLVAALRHKIGGPGFDSRQDSWKFSKWPNHPGHGSVALESTQLVTEMSNKELPSG